MDIINFQYAGSDCPGLDKSPRSREHAVRFFSHTAMKNPPVTGAAAKKKEDMPQNHADQRAAV